MKLEETINSNLTKEEVVQKLSASITKNSFFDSYSFGKKYLRDHNVSHIQLKTTTQPFIDISIKVESETIIIKMIYDDNEKSLIQGLGYGLGLPIVVVIFLMLVVLDPTNPDVYLGSIFALACLYLLIRVSLFLRTEIDLKNYMKELKNIINI